MKKILRFIYLMLAFLFLGIGIVGIVLPVLPTTPFLLLAAALFARSSEKFHKWFTGTSLYDKYINQALNKKAMTKETKRKAMVTLAIIFAAGFIFSPVWYAKAIIAVVAAGHVYYFAVKIKTVEEGAEEAEIIEIERAEDDDRTKESA